MEEILNSEEIQNEEVIALEKLEKERREILNSAISGKIGNIREKVAFILNNFTSARNSDIELAWLYWGTFEHDLFNGSAVTKLELLKLTKISSLTRIRAKIQNEYKLFQADDNVKKHRGVLEEVKKQEAIDDKPSNPLYTIYIDETGKTQKYLSVGSLWDTDPKSTFFARFKMGDWIEQHNIDYEFHFAELKNQRLEQYKAFFLKFLILHPGVGFKAIIINRTGLSNNSAITDLTFHLINNGIKHENDTGRAPLPRLLQIRLDNDEEGSDQLKIANIKERLVSQQIEGLYFDSFEVVDSKDSIYLQVVDLFVSSINRKLHNPISKENPKDELADYILGLLHFNIDNLDMENNNADKSKVFNLTYKG